MSDEVSLAHIRDVVIPKMYQLMPGRMRSDRATLMLLAIGLQESGFKHRAQLHGGPARGFWQFERGGLAGVMTHRHTEQPFRELCAQLGMPTGLSFVHNQLAVNDVLASGVARLLLWTHHKPLPGIGDIDIAWNYYIDLWRPGKPHRERWTANYANAVEALNQDGTPTA